MDMVMLLPPRSVHKAVYHREAHHVTLGLSSTASFAQRAPRLPEGKMASKTGLWRGVRVYRNLRRNIPIVSITTLDSEVVLAPVAGLLVR